MKLCVLWSVILSVKILVSNVYSFNLETRLPIVKLGANGSYFGYSVAEHQSINEVDESITQEWLLVGAPLDQNRQPGTNRSGALWRCPVSTKSNDCDQVITDGKKTPDGLYDSSIDSSELMAPTDDEIKDGQWMGVTVRSQGPGKKVMVCAHRYMLKGPDYRWGQGLCYTLTQFLDYDQNWEPCKGRPTNKAHEQYGFCQAGTSGMLLQDDTMLIGSPGPYTWRGTLYVIDIQDNYIDRDQTKYFGPVEERTSPVDKYSYLGMSVTGGHFLGPNMSYAAGAPRSNNSGQVVLFTKLGLNENIMEVRLTINGEQFGSSFGYEMATADVNGDKRSDLIVSAPFFFNKEEGGAVYVYVNDEDYCLNCNKPIKLTGKPESRFGFALSNLGDLNKDGFDDIAVGAPYEEAGVVYIYLGSIKGLINVPAQTIRASELPRLQYPYDLQTFGYSLSGGLDLDHNGYPDLLVGAYDSAAVVLLRSRPIIGIVTKIQPDRNLRGIDPSQPGCAKDPNSKYTCFTFDACCTIETVVKNRVNNLTLIYEIEAETFERKFSRVWFGPNSDAKNYTMRRHIVLKPDSKKGELHHCQEETVYIKDNTRDIQSPIKFRLSYALDQRQPREARQGQALPSVDDFPILNQQEAAKTFHATFLTDCGDNDVCESDVRVHAELALPPGSRQRLWQLRLGKDQVVVLNISVVNDGESAYEAQLFVSHPQSLNYISQDKTQSKQLICTPFNKTLVACTLGNPFKRGVDADLALRFDPKGIQDSESKLDIVVFANSTSQEVEKKRPTKLHAHVVRRAELSLKGTVQPDHIFYGGDVRGESAMKYTNDIGSRVLHAYRVINEGPWKVGSLDVHIEWPFQVANNKPQGKWLLYMEDKPTVESVGGGECQLIPGQANPLSLPTQPDANEPPLEALTQPGPSAYTANHSDGEPTFRRRRDTEVIVKAASFQNKEGNWEQVVEMSCIHGTAKCFKFVCSIYNLQPKQEAIINIRARLWNSTLVEDYPKVDIVRVKSRGKIHLPPGYHIEQSTADDEFELETVAYPDLLHQQESEPVPIWIIVVAIVAGLLLLVLLTLVLWKLGFFKRRRPDPTLSGNLEKSHRDEADS